MLKQVAQRDCGYPIFGSQLGQGLERSDLVKDIPALVRRGWISSPLKVSSNPSNPNHSIILSKIEWMDR